MTQPVAIVISGLPCSGKSTLAANLQARCRWPLLAKDVFKESLFDTLGIGDRAWSSRISTAAYALLFKQAKLLLDCRQSLILEANFRNAHHAADFAKLATSNARFVQVHCHAEASVLVQRYRERVSDDVTGSSKRRHPGHVDALAAEEIERELVSTVQSPLLLPRLNPSEVVACDTSAGASFAIEEAVARILVVVMDVKRT